MSLLHKDQVMVCQGRDIETWPQVIHRLWRAAQAEHQRLVIDSCSGDRFVISTGPIATRADAVEFVDDDGSKRTLDFVEIVRILLTAGQRQRIGVPPPALESHPQKADETQIE